MGLEGSSEAGFMLIICGFLLFCFVVSLPVWWGLWKIFNWSFGPFGSPKNVKYSPSRTGYKDRDKLIVVPDTWDDIRRDQKEEAKREDFYEGQFPPRQSIFGVIFGGDDD